MDHQRGQFINEAIDRHSAILREIAAARSAECLAIASSTRETGDIHIEPSAPKVEPSAPKVEPSVPKVEPSAPKVKPSAQRSQPSVEQYLIDTYDKLNKAALTRDINAIRTICSREFRDTCEPIFRAYFASPNEYTDVLPLIARDFPHLIAPYWKLYMYRAQSIDKLASIINCMFGTARVMEIYRGGSHVIIGSDPNAIDLDFTDVTFWKKIAQICDDGMGLSFKDICTTLRYPHADLYDSVLTFTRRYVASICANGLTTAIKNAVRDLPKSASSDDELRNALFYNMIGQATRTHSDARSMVYFLNNIPVSPYYHISSLMKKVITVANNEIQAYIDSHGFAPSPNESDSARDNPIVSSVSSLSLRIDDIQSTASLVQPAASLVQPTASLVQPTAKRSRQQYEGPSLYRSVYDLMRKYRAYDKEHGASLYDNGPYYYGRICCLIIRFPRLRECICALNPKMAQRFALFARFTVAKLRDTDEVAQYIARQIGAQHILSAYCNPNRAESDMDKRSLYTRATIPYYDVARLAMQIRGNNADTRANCHSIADSGATMRKFHELFAPLSRDELCAIIQSDMDRRKKLSYDSSSMKVNRNVLYYTLAQMTTV